MLQILKYIFYYPFNLFKKKFLLNNCGQSIAEFAVITAMMATFVTTAAPRLSLLMEESKTQKSIQEIDKILLQAKNFYETTSQLEGRGRLPGQDKYNMAVGSYTDTLELFQDLENFKKYDNVTIGSKWVSVFGKKPTDSDLAFQEDTLVWDVDSEGEVLCQGCPDDRDIGSVEWYHLFNREILESPYQDGHFIYVVIPGSGTGDSVKAPRICIADAENPKHFHKVMDL